MNPGARQLFESPRPILTDVAQNHIAPAFAKKSFHLAQDR